MSRSVYGVVRGLHLRVQEGEGKLVRCSYGRVFDVVVDLRPSSPAYRTWLSVEALDGDLQNSIFIPPGCAHGFQVLTETADTSYRITRAHEPSEDVTIAHDDPETGDSVATGRDTHVRGRPARSLAGGPSGPAQHRLGHRLSCEVTPIS